MLPNSRTNTSKHSLRIKSAAELLRRKKARRGLLDFTQYTFKDYMVAPHLEQLAAKLEAVERGECKRLIVVMPPRHGKSELVSIRFPCWYLGKHPEDYIVKSSYSETITLVHSRQARDVFVTPEMKLLFPNIHYRPERKGQETIIPERQAASEWGTKQGGSYYAVGIGGGLTGRGFNCLPAGTLIETNIGLIPIEHLYSIPPSVKILSYNEQNKELEYRDLQAFAERPRSGLYRITTTTGRVVEATSDHRIWTAAGYKEASQLTAGDTIMQLVWSGIPTSSLCNQEAHNQRLQRCLLFSGMLGGTSCRKEQEAMSVRGIYCYQDEQILFEVPPIPDIEFTQREVSGEIQDLPDMQQYIQVDVERCKGGQVCNVLRQAMCSDRSLTANGGEVQSDVEGRCDSVKATATLGKGISNHEAVHTTSRQQRVRGLSYGEASARSPYRQLADEQCRIEPCNFMCGLSPSMAQHKGTVALVEDLHESAIVYDIQIEGNENFFANGVLVHNCGIIDDPIKDAEEAQSQLIRDKIWDWYRTVFRTRANPGAAIICVQTRWHHDDLVGRLLNQSKEDPSADQWDVLHFRALTDKTPLWPERYSLDDLMATKSSVGSRNFEALYQGEPSIAEGNIIKRSWWREYENTPQYMNKVHSWDTAFSAKGEANYSVCTVWGISDNGYYLLDVWRGRVDFPELKATAVQLYHRDRPQAVLIEEKATGGPLVQELQSAYPIPVLPVQPHKDKITRAYAITPMIEAGKVLIPKAAPWLFDYLEEMSAFPTGQYDDQVDSTTQFLNWINLREEERVVVYDVEQDFRGLLADI